MNRSPCQGYALYYYLLVNPSVFTGFIKLNNVARFIFRYYPIFSLQLGVVCSPTPKSSSQPLLVWLQKVDVNVRVSDLESYRNCQTQTPSFDIGKVCNIQKILQLKTGFLEVLLQVCVTIHSS